MASMRDIKRRKISIQSTEQITKAMKLVSTVKLQRAKVLAEKSKPYFDHMYETVSSMLSKSGNISHPYLKSGTSTKKAMIVITSNRGLAGGYNSNITKLITNGEFDKNDLVIYAVGKKGKDILSRKGYTIKEDYSNCINEPIYKDAVEIGSKVLNAFANNEVGEIYLVYTKFKNTVTQIPTMVKLLPVDIDHSKNDSKKVNSLEDLTLMNYEPAAEEALDKIIPKYMNSIIYGGLVESLASENGARMQAMESATNNAEDMIAELSLKYNRARQGSITQEITEIIAGASAIN